MKRPKEYAWLSQNTGLSLNEKEPFMPKSGPQPDSDSSQSPDRPSPLRPKFNVTYILLSILAMLAFQSIFIGLDQGKTIPYSQFEELLEQGQIKKVTIRSDQILGELKEAKEDGLTRFTTTMVDPDLAAKLSQAQVEYDRQVESTFLMTILSWILPALVFVGIWFFLIGRMAKSGGLGGQLMSVGKSKAKVYVEKDTKVNFDQVAGVEEAKAELVEVVNFLKNQKKFSRLGARMPKGILLVGPPGTGKTLLAKAVAGEAGVPFFSINGSEFVEMFVGVGAARVRDLFEQARKKAPCIIFVDELDALGRSRAAGIMGGGHDEKEQTLNQLLVELDGFDSESGIVLLAATNRPEILDPALLRSGRFDRQILVDRPDKEGRLQILRVHSRKVSLSKEVDLEKIAALTAGFTGADLANLCNEAALVATRREGDAVTTDDFTKAIERIIAGLEKKNRLLREKEKVIVAHHELGHALVAAALPGTDPVHKVSIIPRGIGALGYTIQRPTEDRYLMSKEELENKMAVLLGGRAAELLVFGELSTGAADDISKATNIAREMVTRYGMDPDLGSVTYEENRSSMLQGAFTGVGQQLNYSEESAMKIDRAVRSLVEGAMARAQAILNQNAAVLTEAAQLLLQQETLGEVELKPIFAQLQRS